MLISVRVAASLWRRTVLKRKLDADRLALGGWVWLMGRGGGGWM